MNAAGRGRLRRTPGSLSNPKNDSQRECGAEGSAVKAFALPDPCLVLITDRRQVARGTLDDVVARAVEGGVDLVQLREKDLPDDELHALAAALRAETAGRALLFVNGRADVAAAVRADGVQLGETAEPVASVRRRVGTGTLIGRSVHDREGALAAERVGADLLVLGTVYPSRSHPGGAVGGPSLVAAVAAAVRLPVIAVGGITDTNAADVIQAGACGVAVISAILAAGNPAGAAAALRGVVDEACRRSQGDDSRNHQRTPA